jgi:hypothetical protein
MYALGRVLDVLIAPFQPVNDDPALLNWVTGRPWWTGRLPDRSALPALAAAIGCVRISEDEFHPFFHVIVTVEPAEAREFPDTEWFACASSEILTLWASPAPSRHSARPLPTAGHRRSRLHPLRSCR